MRKKNYKGRCEKRVLSKCKGICRTYDALQYAYADMLEENEKQPKKVLQWMTKTMKKLNTTTRQR